MRKSARNIAAPSRLENFVRSGMHRSICVKENGKGKRVRSGRI